MPVDIVFSFSDRDKEAAAALERHLTPLARSGRIALWHREKVLHGEDPDLAWLAHAQQAKIIILLVSSHLDIDRDGDITVALAQREERHARVIPVLWRSVDLNDLRFKSLRMVPSDRAIGERKEQDSAWVEVVQGIRRVVEAVEAEGDIRPPARSAARPADSAPTAEPAAAARPVQVPPPPAEPPGTSRLKILFLGANPSDTIRLRLPEERREIDRRIQLGSHRDRFELNDAWAVTASDLSQTLLRYKPRILHFSGHGSEQGELLLNNDSGKMTAVSPSALASLFEIFVTMGLRCVVLNACYSEAQSTAIVEYVDCVVGITGKLEDGAANAFTAGFYAGLAAGESVQTAFNLGCVQIALLGLTGANQPKLRGRPGVKLDKLTLT